MIAPGRYIAISGPDSGVSGKLGTETKRPRKRLPAGPSRFPGLSVSAYLRIETGT